MAPPKVKHWKNDAKYNGLLNFLIEKTESVESPIKIQQLIRDFKDKSGISQTLTCLRSRIKKICAVIHRIGHIDTNTKVKVLFALGVPVNAYFFKKLNKDAVVEVDGKKRITKYEATDGNLKLNGDQSHSARNKNAKLQSKRNLRSLINSYFEKKNDADAVPDTEEEKEMGSLIEFITEKCDTVDTPLSISRLIKDFNNRSGISRSLRCIHRRVKEYCRGIQKSEFLDTQTKVRQLFGLSVTLDSDYFKELRKDAVVEVDELNRITKYAANDGSLTLCGDHSQSAKLRTAQLALKRSHRSLIKSYFEDENDADAVPKTEEEKEMGNLIEFISEKCENVSYPLNITRLAKDFNNHFGIARSLGCIENRIKSYCREIQRTELFDTQSKIKQLFGLSATLDLNYLEKLRKDAVVEVDDINRIKKYTSNNGSLTLLGNRSSSATKSNQIEKRKSKTVVKKRRNSGDDEDEDSEKEDGYSEDEGDEYSSEEDGSEFDSDDENDSLDETTDPMEPSSKADEFDNETPVRNRSPTQISIDDNFDFDPSPEKEDDTGMKSFSETLPNSQISSSTSHTPKTPKRKADASVGSSTLKRTKPLPEESMNPRNSNDNISHDDPSRVKVEPFRGLLRPPNGIEEDPDIHQIRKPSPQVMEAPIKKECAEEAQTSLKTVFTSFKSLILSLDTPGLMQLQVELDTKIEKTGRGIEVSNKEMIMAIELLVVKLSKHGALKSSEDSISLRDFLLMLRMILLNPSFNGLEDILKMLKENIDQLKDLDKKVPVSKVDSVLRATIDSIST
ncbi:unnamed protein product [Caenorhabditis brenneri]